MCTFFILVSQQRINLIFLLAYYFGLSWLVKDILQNVRLCVADCN